MIPKIIHYCWFGGKPLPEDAKRCIASWKRYLPDYKIKEWNESNFDIHCNTYCSQAYDAKKFAFVSDFARLWILYHEGGVYFDTDVEVIKPLNDILENGAYMGCETSPSEKHNFITVNPGLGIAAQAGHGIYKELIEQYNQRSFIKNDGSMDLKTIVATTTEMLVKHGLNKVPDIQCIEGITIYPQEYFCPISTDGEKNITQHTRTIHHFAQSWLPNTHIRLRKMIMAIGGWRLKRFASRIYRMVRH